MDGGRGGRGSTSREIFGTPEKLDLLPVKEEAVERLSRLLAGLKGCTEAHFRATSNCIAIAYLSQLTQRIDRGLEEVLTSRSCNPAWYPR